MIPPQANKLWFMILEQRQVVAFQSASRTAPDRCAARYVLHLVYCVKIKNPSKEEKPQNLNLSMRCFDGVNAEVSSEQVAHLKKAKHKQ